MINNSFWNRMKLSVSISTIFLLQGIGLAQGQPMLSAIEPMVAGFRGGVSTQAWVDCETGGVVTLGQTRITIPPGVLFEDGLIQIGALPQAEVAPLPQEVVNVTAGQGAYRFLPSGHQFSEPATIELPFDQQSLPAGMGPERIAGFYFERSSNRWTKLRPDSIALKAKRIFFKTTHFTDFIAGIIQVPESPTTNSLISTSFKDYKAQDAGAGISLIAPPAATQMGAGQLNFPLNLPPGRMGVQPDLAVSYNNEGGNGWLGLGWSLSAPGVSIDTRWGVPRFLRDKESETYLLNGDQLLPVAHRLRWEERTSNPAKPFHRRVEGPFEKIIRHGRTTREYWWEVRDKDGGRRYYGGMPGQGMIPGTVLEDEDGNVVHWFLAERRDVHGNFIRYHYREKIDNGQPGSLEKGYNKYLHRITYTGFDGKEGAFAVKFILGRDPELGESRRVDAFVDCTLRFKRVTADLLRKVEVTYKNRLVRSYEFKYRKGRYSKMLLTSIREHDRDGELFYEHTFEYYDDVGNSSDFQPLGTDQQANILTDRLSGELSGGIQNPDNLPSALGAQKAKNFSIGGAITIGSLGNVISKNNTGGGYYDYSNTKSYGISELIDIDGDQLPDKIFQSGSRLYYRKNLGPVNGVVSFAKLPVEIPGISVFSYAKTKGHSYGLEGTFGLGKGDKFTGYISKGWAKSRTVNPVYFADFNGDMIMDIAIDGVVYFNCLDKHGLPRFVRDSDDTPNPIISTESISEDLLLDEAGDRLEFEDENPLNDVVRYWVGPRPGRIRIEAPIRLLPDAAGEEEDYPFRDGVRATIEYGGKILDSIRIEGADFELHPWVYELDYEKVENIQRRYLLKPLHFRLHSIYDGAYDQVEWNPKIVYLHDNGNELSQQDPNGKDIYQYDAGADYLLVSAQTVAMPFAGKMKIRGPFRKPVLSDDIRLSIVRARGDEEQGNVSIDTIYSRPIPWNEAVDEKELMKDMTIDVLENDRLQFLVAAHSNVDWQQIKWEPEFGYLEDAQGTNLLDSAGQFLVRFKPAVGFTMYNQVLRQGGFEIIDPEKEFEVNVFSFVNQNTTPAPPPVPKKDATLTVIVKGPNRLYSAKTVRQHPWYGTFPGIGGIKVPEEQLTSDTIYVEAYFSDFEVAEYYLRYGNFRSSFGRFSIFSAISQQKRVLGPLYRGWGQYAYKGEKEKGQKPIDEKVIREAFNEYRGQGDFSTDKPDQLSPDKDPIQKDFGILYANMELRRWQGYDDLVYIATGIASSSRMGDDNPEQALALGRGTGLRAPVKVSKTRSSTFSGNINFSIKLKKTDGDSLPAGVTYSDSKTSSWQHIDLFDFNKDGYLDLLANGKIQDTNPFGGRMANTWSVPADDAPPHHHSSSAESGFTFSGKVSAARVDNTQQTRAFVGKSVGASFAPWNGSFSMSQNINLTKHISVGVNTTYNETEDATDNSWGDINGDGLIDMIFSDGTARLNYGYRFGEREQWGFEAIRKGRTVTSGAKLSLGGDLDPILEKNGLAKWHGSITAGRSLGISENHSVHGLQDVNGDGLADILTVRDGQLWASLHRGTDFAPAILWHESFLLDEGRTANQSWNGAFTICIPLFFVRICINPRGDRGSSLSRSQSRIADINGDGYVDFLQSTNDAELRFRLAKTGRTNMLKTVRRPLGGSFTMNYQSTGSSYDLPQNHWVLSEVTIDDGLEGDGVDLMKTTFAYENGYYDRREKEFFGFAKVISREHDTTQDDEVYRVSTTGYYNGTYYRKGNPVYSEMRDREGRIFARNTYQYELRKPGDNSVLVDTFRADNGRAFLAMVREQTYFHEGKTDPGLVRTVQYEYDLYGNVISYADLGDGTENDWVQADIQYHYSESPHYLLSIPKEIQVFTNRGLVRSRDTEIDEVGNVKRIRQFLEVGQPATWDFQYDKYGNRLRVDRPVNHAGERLNYVYTYDDEVYTYVTTIEDAYGYSSSSLYDVRYGQMLENTDLNGQKSKYTIDAKGRITTVQGPYQSNPGEYTIAIEYYPRDTVPHSVVRHFDPEHGGDILTTTFLDGLKRVVQVKKTAEITSSSGGSPVNASVISGRTVFDAFGRTVANYYPTMEASGLHRQFSKITDEISPTTTAYDVLDRPLRVTLPDQAEIRTSYDIGPDNDGYTCFTTQVEDPLHNIKNQYHDIRKRLRATTDHWEEGEIWTAYRYNPISELLRVTDNKGHETRYSYDRLGRKKSVFHPDAGLTEYDYDLANNLLLKVTPNIRESMRQGAGIRYFYEYERLVKVAYPRNIENNVKFTYGKPGAPHNRAGRIWLQEDGTGAKEFFYGRLGEEIKNIRTILVNEAAILTYVSEAEFDTWNRIQKMVYPDGEVVDYEYNPAGKLSRVTGRKGEESFVYIDRIGYDKFEDRTYLRQGNGAETSYEYDPDRRWLLNAKVRTPASGNFIDCRYTYDLVGNILSNANQVATENSAFLGGPSEHRYYYDQLYRLNQADGTWSRFGKEENYSLDLQYDDLHNIKSKSLQRTTNNQVVSLESYSHDYDYREGRPHIANRIGERNYEYDANGNLTYVDWPRSYEHREMSWDEENRLRAVHDNGYLNRYTYDAQGERVVKSHGAVQSAFFNGAEAGFVNHEDNYTVYVSPYLVARAATFTKHYFIEGQRIASKIGTGNFTNNSARPSTGLTAGEIDFTDRIYEIRQILEAYYSRLLGPPGEPTLYNFNAQPEQTGEPFDTIYSNNSYTNTAPHWINSYRVGPPDPDGPPGEPVWTGPRPTNDDVTAGYGFDPTSISPENQLYFYHSDHLGSTNYITNGNGEISQHVEYIPFGETFVEEYTFETADLSQPYLFNGKELDRETGLYYYGARYYDPRTSIWVSADPLMEKYPGWSPYCYTLLNPVRLVDPDGRQTKVPDSYNARRKYLNDAIKRSQPAFDAYLKERNQDFWESGHMEETLQFLANVSAGAGSGFSSGITDHYLATHGLSGMVDENSSAFQSARMLTSFLQELAFGKAALVLDVADIILEIASNDIYDAITDTFSAGFGTIIGEGIGALDGKSFIKENSEGFGWFAEEWFSSFFNAVKDDPKKEERQITIIRD